MKTILSKAKNATPTTLTAQSRHILAKITHHSDTSSSSFKACWFSVGLHLKYLRQLADDGNYILTPRRVTLIQFRYSVSNPAHKVMKYHCPLESWDGIEFYSFAIRPSHPLYLDKRLIKANQMGSTSNKTRSNMIKCFSNLPISGMSLEKWQYDSKKHTICFLGEKLIQ